MPAADTDTQDSVRARRRRCAEPLRVSFRRPCRPQGCRHARLAFSTNRRVCFIICSVALFLLPSLFHVVFVSQYNQTFLLLLFLLPVGLRACAPWKRMCALRLRTGGLPIGGRRSCQMSLGKIKCNNPARGGELD